MSGSSITQDRKLVDEITHVMVVDPTRGYEVFIENILVVAQDDFALIF